MRRFQNADVRQAAVAVAELLQNATSAVAFTGAGISTESGIPDFRSPGGVWANNRTVYFEDFLRSADERYEYWLQKAEAHRGFSAAQPNITHKTIANWEANGQLRGVITQNIDGLHQVAGSQAVLELHGTARSIGCLDCCWMDKAEHWVALFREHDRVPDCPDCGGRLKHATVSFGQSLPSEILATAGAWAEEADVFLTLGSSLVVEPAASLPRMAKHNGARLIIINRDPTPLDGSADIVVNASLGDVFQAVTELMDH